MSTAEGVDLKKRRFLTLSATALGGVGAVFLAVPFLRSWTPSERAQAAGAPVEVDVSRLEPGQMIIVEWRGKPVWVVHRTERQLEDLPALADRLLDPDSRMPQQPPYAANEYRSRRPELLVMVGICTHLGCSPTFRPEVAPADLGPNWRGGFFCPCHGSRFDLAGRVYSGVPAPSNMIIPPYKYLSDTRIMVGDDTEA